MKPLRWTGCALLLLAASACSSKDWDDIIYDNSPDPLLYASPSRTIVTSQAHGPLKLTIRTVGPGHYIDPPDVTGHAVQFVSVSLAAEQVPAGPTQVFTFGTPSVGTSIITFRNTESPTVVVDTIVVQ